MSGIAGVFHRCGKAVERSLLQRMLAAMGHRGPDGAAALVQGSVGLGYLHLQTGPDEGRQPLTWRDLCLVADARIDNRKEVCAALGISAGQEAVSDAGLILHAYEHWGEKCAQRLLGDFVFGVWDGHRQELFLARDHFGAKPLYYYCDGEIIAFASEIKALLILPEVPREADDVMIGDHLSGMFYDPEITYWRGIKRLPGAHTLSIGRDGPGRIHRYWALDPQRELRLGSDREYIDGLRALFVQAVSRRSSGTATMGAAISGGLDSTAVACTAAQVRRERGQGPLHSFSLVYDHLPDVDERRWIEPTLAQGHFIPHYVTGDEIDPLALLPDMMYAEDGIVYAPNLFLTWEVYAEARRSGVRVMLEGFDGDSTLSHGVHYPRELLLRGRAVRAWREVHALARRHGRSTPEQAGRLGLLTTGLGLGTRIRAVRHRLRGGPPDSSPPLWDQFGLLNPAFAERIALPERYERLAGDQQRQVRTEREGHYRQIAWPLQTFLLETLDRAAAMNGIEVRNPFFDVQLVEFCLAMPGNLKLRDGWTRWAMREAMAGILPPEVQWRPGKSNLSPVLPLTLNRYGRAAVEELARRPDAIAPFVNAESLQALAANATPRSVMSIWLPLALDHGLRFMQRMGQGAAAPP
jgi:asparagine synthase (glutamine-hydrolysing)